MEILSEEEEKRTETSLSSKEIREVCKMWETVQKFIEKHHPSKAVAVRAMLQCHKKKSQQIAVIPLVTMKVVLPNN
jgi:hypothetical protein